MVLNAAMLSRGRQTVASAVEVAIVAAGNAIPLHQVDDLLAAITLIERGVVEKAEFFLLPPGLQGRLQPNQLPVENLGAVPLPVLLIKPSPGPAQGDVPIEMAVIVEQMEGGKSIFLEDRSILAAVFHQ